ncbi:MAG TPA: galactitol-1-phosphate 5-dehydrogenase [Terracidiphilus sp.]|nr:galactitol-1-phosphate 5-dehydrogenase [Terracidiphilus sp.]
MKSLLLSAYNQLDIVEMPAPSAGAGEVLIRVEACGICGSDVHGMDGSTGRRIPPIVMGHEAAGTVAEVGAGVDDIAVGDRVTFDSTISCGECDYCLRGDINLCDNREVIGVSCGDYRRHGAFAEYVSVPRRIVYKLPDTMPLEEAAMLEAISVAMHAVRVSGARAGETAVVVGAGMIGLLTLQASRAAGCTSVYISDLDPTRLALAVALGADHALPFSGLQLARRVAELNGGNGADHVFEAVGNEETVLTAVDCARKGGTVTLIGNIVPEVTLPLQKVVSRQIRMQGSCASAGEYPQAIEYVATGKIKVRPLITAVASLEEGPRWFERLRAREPNLMKIVLTPGKP